MISLYNFSIPVQGRLIKRYKRFLADVELQNGTIVTAHCTNTGSMKGVCVPGQPVILSQSQNPLRKLKYTWEAIELNEAETKNKVITTVGVNTANPNKLVAEGLKQGIWPQFGCPQEVKQEASLTKKTNRAAGTGTRLDFYWPSPNKSLGNYLEVKNVTLAEVRNNERIAFFPDSVSERGTKHLRELAALADRGHRSILLFVVQRLDCQWVEPAEHIDPIYAQTLREVVTRHGVEVIAFAFKVDLKGISFSHQIPVKI